VEIVSHLVGGLVMGALAILVGGAFISGAVRRQRSHAYDSSTYRQAGGPVYTVFQVGCGGVLLLAGVGILVLVLLGGPPT
jgi:hypothetical protein